MTRKKGKLIVIDGSDGSGKSTQTKLLYEYLQAHKIPSRHLKFPRYNEFYGELVARFLRGEFGGLHDISPYLASLPYALDRLSAKPEMEKHLHDGEIVLLDRYVPSNMGHQGARLSDKERDAYYDWDYTMEYEINKLPKEDLVIYLYVPYTIAAQLRAKETNKEYLKGAHKDILESDIENLKRTEESYLSLSKKYKHWIKIDCVEDNNLLSIETIHKKIKNELVKLGILKDNQRQ